MAEKDVPNEMIKEKKKTVVLPDDLVISTVGQVRNILHHCTLKTLVFWWCHPDQVSLEQAHPLW